MAMIRSRRTKVVLLLSLLVMVSVAVGFFIGIVLSSIISKKKEDPAFWKQAATKHLEKLHPTDEQRKKFEARTDSAVQELTALQKEGITRIWDVINRATADIDKELTPEQYDVARKHGTEKPFKNALWDNKKKGVYSCVCCGQNLYSSEHKFDSGTGWPSFWQPIKDANIGQTEDRKLFYTRVESHCSRCDAHLGHVFDDATGKGSVPKTPTGKRFCMNSAAMKFAEKK